MTSFPDCCEAQTVPAVGRRHRMLERTHKTWPQGLGVTFNLIYISNTVPQKYNLLFWSRHLVPPAPPKKNLSYDFVSLQSSWVGGRRGKPSPRDDLRWVEKPSRTNQTKAWVQYSEARVHSSFQGSGDSQVQIQRRCKLVSGESVLLTSWGT